MDGSSSSSSSKRGGHGLPPIPPQHIAEDDVPNDPVARRRQANREYSERYRQKQRDHVKELEEQEKTLLGEISQTCPQIKLYKDVGSYLVTENNSLMGTFSEAISNLHAENAEADKLQSEVKQLKMIKEAHEAQISDGFMNFRNN